jgi:hypothetical protein
MITTASLRLCLEVAAGIADFTAYHECIHLTRVLLLFFFLLPPRLTRRIKRM